MSRQDLSTRSSATLESKRNYPYNCWWVAATIREVSRKPLSRWLLEQRVALFRLQDGTPVALEDRCAHRWAPLSQGKVLGDEIACPYHGFRYDSRGRCTLVPSQSHAPSALQLRSYPVRDHGGYVWVWMGDSNKADPALLPEIPWFVDPTFIRVGGYLEVGCNYMLIQENVLDLTHVAHLHADAQQEGWQEPPSDVIVTDSAVTYRKSIANVPVAPIIVDLMGVDSGSKLDRLDWGTFFSPACHVSGSDYQSAARGKGARSRYIVRGLHCTTPVSPNRCHYWWGLAQDFGRELPDEELSVFVAELNSFLEGVVKQDREVLEAIQTTIEQDIRGESAPEGLVGADRAVVAARRILKKSLEAQAR